jgi:hypothetical protein
MPALQHPKAVWGQHRCLCLAHCYFISVKGIIEDGQQQNTFMCPRMMHTAWLGTEPKCLAREAVAAYLACCIMAPLWQLLQLLQLCTVQIICHVCGLACSWCIGNDIAARCVTSCSRIQLCCLCNMPGTCHKLDSNGATVADICAI